MIATPWPHLQIYAAPQGEIDPYDTANTSLFRGEEAFAPDVTGWRRWSKPSPEPPLDAEFERLLLDSIARERKTIASLTARLAQNVAATLDRPPLLIAILRAGVPLGALLRHALQKHFNDSVPLVALSLFQGLGWDEAALEAVLQDYPGHPVWFVDGWTSGGGVAQELSDSFMRWIASGRADFTHGRGPRLAVLCDPRNKAQASAIRADVWVPSSCFTAPETLGFSRGFARPEGGLFGVYTFPQRLLRPHWVKRWLQVAGFESAPLPQGPYSEPAPPPPGWRIHINEVVRALINRSPREVLLRDDTVWAQQHLAPVLHLCRLRGVPVRYKCGQVATWGAIAAARMSD